MSRLKTFSSDKDFKYLFRHGRKLENNMFKVWFSGNNLSFHRFVFSVPVSVDKRSTVRNKLKRRTKEWVRRNIGQTNRKNLDVFLSFKKDITQVTKNEFYKELDKIFKQVFS